MLLFRAGRLTKLYASGMQGGLTVRKRSAGELLLKFYPGTGHYTIDFSVGHLKKVIRSLTKAPEVKKVHLLAHSRGSAVLLQALRELMLETYVFGEAPGDVLKVENLVLMAADVEIQFALQKLTLGLGKK